MIFLPLSANHLIPSKKIATTFRFSYCGQRKDATGNPLSRIGSHREILHGHDPSDLLESVPHTVIPGTAGHIPASLIRDLLPTSPQRAGFSEFDHMQGNNGG